MQDKEIQFAEIVKLFGLVFNQYRLYSEKHPAAQLATRNFFAKLALLLESELNLTLGLVDGRVVINAHTLDNLKSGVADMQREWQRLRIESLIFERGITEEELSSFFSIAAMPPKALEEKGGLKEAFGKANFQHIRLGTALYKKIKEGEDAVTTLECGVKGAVLEDVRRIERMEELIEYYLTESREAVTFDIGRLGYEVERSPKTVAEAMVRRAIEFAVLKRIVEGVAGFLKEYLAPAYLREGKDFSQPIYTLAIEFKKILRGVGIKEAGDLAFILERCADAVKVELMVRAFKGGDQKTLERMARLSRKGARERLKDKLIDLGVEKAVFDGLFSEKGAPGKARKVGVSSEELEELRRIRDRFDEELARRVKEQTAMIEREKRRALDEKGRVDKIVSNIGGALVVVDVEGQIQFMNPAAQKLLDPNRGQGDGLRVADLLKDRRVLDPAESSPRDRTGWVTREIELMGGSDETRRVLQACTAVIESEDGQAVGVFSILTEITEERPDKKFGPIGAI